MSSFSLKCIGETSLLQYKRKKSQNKGRLGEVKKYLNISVLGKEAMQLKAKLLEEHEKSCDLKLFEFLLHQSMGPKKRSCID